MWLCLSLLEYMPWVINFLGIGTNHFPALMQPSKLIIFRAHCGGADPNLRSCRARRGARESVCCWALMRHRTRWRQCGWAPPDSASVASRSAGTASALAAACRSRPPPSADTTWPEVSDCPSLFQQHCEYRSAITVVDFIVILTFIIII